MTATAVDNIQTDKDERKLKKVMIGLMRQPEFALFSGIMMCGSTGIRDDVPTAATDGYNVFFGRKFIRTLDEKMIAFVLMHENLHKAFRHLSVYRRLFEENARLTNMAADYVINLMLVQMDPSSKYMTFPVIDGKRIGLLDQKYAGMDTKQVYYLLKEDQKNKPKPQKGQGQGGEGESGESDDEEEGDASGGAEDGSFDEHMWEESKQVPKEQQEQQVKELDRALRQGQAMAAKLAGKGSLGMNKELGELLDPQLDWKELLREFIQSTCAAKDASSWRRVNRRFIGLDIYMPSLIGESMREIVIGIDASGSTWCGRVLQNFLSEVKAIMDHVMPEKVHIVYWDTKVTGVEEYDSSNLDTLVSTTQIKGGGGTDPSCVENYLKQERIKPECVIMLTDGFVPNWGGSWDNTPLLWVVAGNDSAQANTGKTIHINDD
jgi:predicted metal-dependent peptidase